MTLPSRDVPPLVAGGQGRSATEVEFSARVTALAILALALLLFAGGVL